MIGAHVKVRGDMVRGAITYRFNWTPLGLIFGTDRICFLEIRVANRNSRPERPAVLLG